MAWRAIPCGLDRQENRPKNRKAFLNQRSCPDGLLKMPENDSHLAKNRPPFRPAGEKSAERDRGGGRFHRVARRRAGGRWRYGEKAKQFGLHFRNLSPDQNGF